MFYQILPIYISIRSAYTRMFRGRFRALKFSANLLTDDIELRSRSSISIFAAGTCLAISSLTRAPADEFLTPITTCTPRIARTRHVSAPIPLEAPARNISISNDANRNSGLQYNLVRIFLWRIKLLCIIHHPLTKGINVAFTSWMVKYHIFFYYLNSTKGNYCSPNFP